MAMLTLPLVCVRIWRQVSSSVKPISFNWASCSAYFSLGGLASVYYTGAPNPWPPMSCCSSAGSIPPKSMPPIPPMPPIPAKGLGCC